MQRDFLKELVWRLTDINGGDKPARLYLPCAISRVELELYGVQIIYDDNESPRAEFTTKRFTPMAQWVRAGDWGPKGTDALEWQDRARTRRNEAAAAAVREFLG
jgi:hypothetical protein